MTLKQKQQHFSQGYNMYRYEMCDCNTRGKVDKCTCTALSQIV